MASRWRAAGLALVALGGLITGGGLLVRLYLYPALVKLPLDPASAAAASGGQQGPTTTVLTAHDGVYLSVAGGNLQQRHATLTIRTKVAGDLAAAETQPGGSVAVWRTGTTVMDGGTLIGITTMEACLDRRTGLAVAACSAAYVSVGDQTTKPARVEGLTGPFPFNTQKMDYPFYDPTLHAAVPMHYMGTDAINGLLVYRFESTVSPTRVQSLQVPGNLVGGDPKKVVNAGLFYQSAQTIWVEPVSGTPVKTQTTLRQQLRGPDGQAGAIVFGGDFGMSDSTVRQLTDTAAGARSQLMMLTGTPPTAAMLGGLALIILGVVITLRAGARRRSGADGRPRAHARHEALEDTDLLDQPTFPHDVGVTSTDAIPRTVPLRGSDDR